LKRTPRRIFCKKMFLSTVLSERVLFYNKLWNWKREESCLF
jgi:hypothetical protein